MVQQSVITQKMRDALGVESQPMTYEVEKGAIRRYADAIGDPNPIYRNEKVARKSRYGSIVAPPTFLRSMEASPESDPFENVYPEVLDGGSEWEYPGPPVCAGDQITVTVRPLDFRERMGKLGPMLFVVREYRYANQLGELVATQRSTYIYYQPTE